MAADHERWTQHYADEIARLKPALRKLWGALQGSVDEAFSHCKRNWRSRGYFTKAEQNFFAIEPKGSTQRIEARVHANADDLPRFQEIFHMDDTHSSRETPRVQVYLVEKTEDIAKVIEAARIAEKRWGAGRA